MSITSDYLREAPGAFEYPPTPNPILLQEADQVHVVLEGGVDVFVSTRTSSGDLCARHHFLHIREGGAVFGIPPSDSDIVLIAVATRGARLVTLPLDALREPISANQRWACSLLDNWIEALGARLFAGKVPASFLDASSSSYIELAEDSRAVAATEGVAWITHRRGESYALDNEQLPRLNGSGYFPVSRFTWIQASLGSELKIAATSELPTVDGGWQGLHAFHAVARQLLVMERQASLHQEEEQIRRKAAANRALFGNALSRLALPIGRSPSGNQTDTSCTDPIFLAFEAIANELNIKLVPPMEMVRGRRPADPIGAIAKASSIRYRKVALKGSWWKQQTGPLVCITQKGNHPIAVLTRSQSRRVAFNPISAAVEPVDENFAAAMQPMAYTLYRTFPSSPLGVDDLLRFGLDRCSQELMTIAGTSLAVGILALVNPVAIGVIFDRLIPGAERLQLVQMSLFLVATAITSSMFSFARGFAILRLQGKIDVSLQSAVWDRILSLPVSFFRDYSSGDLAQRSMGVSQIRDVITGTVLDAFLSGIFSVFSFLLLFYYDATLALIATLLVLVACVVTLAIGFVQVRQSREILRQSGALSSKLLQFVQGIAKFRVSGTEGRAFAAWAKDYARQKGAAVRLRRAANWLAVFNAVFPVICLAVLFYAHASLLKTEQVDGLRVGGFLAFLAAFTQFLTAALNLSSASTSVAAILPIYERAKPVLRAVPEVTQAKSDPGVLSGEVEINHVSFAYRPDAPLVLRDVTLRIEAGQSVAFVGSSGCGKSTLFRLLLGFERPASGAIYYDRQDLAGLDVQTVRRQIGVVLQTSRLVSGSIFENIVGSSPLNVEDAWEACRLAGIEDDIRRMPMGLHTCISDGGGGVSGGQKQRLMIARAIVNKPRMLLFDEATSALDNRTQAIVTQSLAGLRATRIVIAHRLSTVVSVDKIFVFDKGTIAESGTYAELMEHRGLFHELAKRQLTS